MKIRYFAIIASLAVTVIGCAEYDEPTFELDSVEPLNPNIVRGYEYPPEVAANADLVIGEIHVLPGIESYTFQQSHWSSVDLVDDETAFVTGSAIDVIEDAGEGDVLFGQDWVARITYIERGTHGWYVGLTPFDLIDITYGDYEIDIGEAIARGIGKEHGMWTVERGWLPVEEWPHLNARIPELNEPDLRGDHVTQRQSVCSGGDPTTCQFFPTLNVAGSFEPQGTGSKITIGGSLALPIDFDAGVHVRREGWGPDVEFPEGYRCANGDEDCLDHLKFYAAPRVELTLQAAFEIAAKLELYKNTTEIRTYNLPGIPVVAGISIVPGLKLSRYAKVDVTNKLTIEAELDSRSRLPVGLEYVRNVQAGRSICGGGVGCQPGYNAIPNARPMHSATNTTTTDLKARYDVATLKGEGGLKAEVTLGVAPSFPFVVIEGPKAGVEFGLEAKYTPVSWVANNSSPCLTLALKATPKVGFQGSVRVKGIRRSLFSLGEYEVEIGAMEFGKVDFPNACLVDFTPSRSVELRVIGANEPDGARDVPGFEIDSVWIERQGQDPIYATNTGDNPNSSGAPDATCGATALYNTTDQILDGQRRTWRFDTDIQSGDKVHVVRINDDGGGSCKMSGTAEVNLIYVSGGSRTLGLVNDSGGIFDIP